MDKQNPMALKKKFTLIALTEVLNIRDHMGRVSPDHRQVSFRVPLGTSLTELEGASGGFFPPGPPNT